MNIIQKSYESHAKHYDKKDIDNYTDLDVQKILNSDSVDFWRHERMRNSALCLFMSYPNSKWLTVGDGRLGLDAHHLESLGLDVTASDIAEPLLKVAKNKGIISKYVIRNCEKMTDADSTYDFVFCKEAYHHFPRPYVALMEMLRVSRIGVVLIEPQDLNIDLNLVQKYFEKTLKILKYFLGKKVENYQFEESGNFVYTISERELTKAAIAIGCRAVAFRQINDYFIPGLTAVKVNSKNPLWLKVKKRLAFSDLLTRMGIRRGYLTTAVIFKNIPSSSTVSSLKKSEFNYVELPANPYL